MATAHFSEQAVRDAVRYILKKEYRRTIAKSFWILGIAAVLVVILWMTGIASLGGLVTGLVVAAGLMALTYGYAYLHNLRFALQVFRNEGLTDVVYEFSDAGCKVSYKGVEALLPWRLLRSRDSHGEYQVLGFSPSETYLSNLKAIADSMGRNVSGPELLGFPIFCATPGPRTRYLFVPTTLLESSRIPTV